MLGTVPVLLVVGVIVATVLAIRWRKNVVRTYFFEPIENGRTLVAVVFGVLIVFVWLRSGTPWKVVSSLLLIAFGVAYIAFEKPHRDIK
jgi:hypothetical protein